MGRTLDCIYGAWVHYIQEIQSSWRDRKLPGGISGSVSREIDPPCSSIARLCTKQHAGLAARGHSFAGSAPCIRFHFVARADKAGERETAGDPLLSRQTSAFLSTLNPVIRETGRVNSENDGDVVRLVWPCKIENGLSKRSRTGDVFARRACDAATFSPFFL